MRCLVFVVRCSLLVACCLFVSLFCVVRRCVRFVVVCWFDCWCSLVCVVVCCTSVSAVCCVLFVCLCVCVCLSVFVCLRVRCSLCVVCWMVAV